MIGTAVAAFAVGATFAILAMWWWAPDRKRIRRQAKIDREAARVGIRLAGTHRCDICGRIKNEGQDSGVAGLRFHGWETCPGHSS